MQDFDSAQDIDPSPVDTLGSRVESVAEDSRREAEADALKRKQLEVDAENESERRQSKESVYAKWHSRALGRDKSTLEMLESGEREGRDGREKRLHVKTAESEFLAASHRDT